MDDPNITIEEYIRLEEEKARRHGRTFNWQTAKFGKIKNYEDEDDCFIDFETEFPAMVFDNTLTAIPSEPTICPPNEHKIDFRISLDESDDEDYTIIFDENSFSGQALEKVAGMWRGRRAGPSRGHFIGRLAMPFGLASDEGLRGLQCMRTRNSNFPNNLNVTILRRRNKRRATNVVEPELRTIVEVAPMAERTMEDLLRAPTEGMNTTSRESFSETDKRIDKLADQISTLVEIVSKKVVTPATVKAVEESCITCGSAHACVGTDNAKITRKRSKPDKHKHGNGYSAQELEVSSKASTSGTLPSNTIPNPKGEMKAITTRSGVAYEGPSIPTNPSPKKVVEQETEETTDTKQTNFQGSTAHIQPPHPQKHANESIKMVNDTCEDSLKETNNLSSGSTTPISDFHPSLEFFETRKSLLERFIDEPALVCLPPPEDDDDGKGKAEVKNIAELTAKRQTRITPCLKNFKVIHKESIFHLNKTPQISLVFAITSALPTIKPKDSLIMGDEHLSTFSVEEIVPIPRESEDTFDNNKGCDLTFCDNNMIFSNPLFGSKDNLTSRDEEIIS
ncbi:hypothetical protein Tco_1405658 [Tanacetum coccineum]